jgi:hypothetical protein
VNTLNGNEEEMNYTPGTRVAAVSNRIWTQIYHVPKGTPGTVVPTPANLDYTPNEQTVWVQWDAETLPDPLGVLPYQLQAEVTE